MVYVCMGDLHILCDRSELWGAFGVEGEAINQNIRPESALLTIAHFPETDDKFEPAGQALARRRSLGHRE